MDTLLVVDNAISERELSEWQSRVRTGVQSTGLSEDDVSGTELFRVAQCHAPGLELIHCLLFEIRSGHDTELHCDVGEYVVLFYPYTNEGAPLRTVQDGHEVLVEVVANRLVALDCTRIAHQQVVPTDDSARYSVAFKFRKRAD